VPPKLDTNSRIEMSAVWVLWQTATFLCLDGLILALENYIPSLFTPDNISHFWSYLQSIESHSLNSSAKNYFSQNITEIVPTQGFLSLDKNLISEVFFTQNELKPSSSRDAQVFNTLALTRWFAAHEPQRLKRKLQESFPSTTENKKLKCKS